MQKKRPAVGVAEAVVGSAGVEDQHVAGFGHPQHPVECWGVEIDHQEPHSGGMDVADGCDDLVGRADLALVEPERLVEEPAGGVVVDDPQAGALHPLPLRRFTCR